MEAIDTKTMKGIRSHLGRGDSEILKEGWEHGADAINFIASEGDDLVYIICQLR